MNLHKFNLSTMNKWMPLLVVVVLLVLFPFAVSNQYLIHVATLCWIIGLASVGWNVAYGYGRLFAFGHTAFFGVGAYVTVFLLALFNITPWIGLLVAAAVNAVFGLFITYLTAKTYGFYFAIVTSAIPSALFVIMTYPYNYEWNMLTGGAFGMPVPFFFAKSPWESLYFMESRSVVPYYFISLFFLAICCTFMLRFTKSKTGYYIRAMGMDLDAAESIGIDTFRVKTICIMVSAAITGIAGGLYAVLLHFIDPYEAFGPVLSLTFILCTMFGGVGTIIGPIIGALLTIGLSELMKLYLEQWFVTGMHLVIYGIILMVTIIVLPRGVYPSLKNLVERALRSLRKTG